MKPKKWNLNGSDWLMKEFVGLDWVWRDSVMPDTKDVRWWYPAKVPGSVVHDLTENGLIPDPYFECNSRMAEWASARTWVYKKEFAVPKEYKGSRIALCFEGIDYQSEIFLNGKSLGTQNGMFVPWEAAVENELNYGEKNLLAVVIEPAPAEQPQVGKTSLVHTHKSRMTYWWDFCPRLIHQGIWQDVYLKVTGRARLEDVWINSTLCGEALARVQIRVKTDNPFFCPVRVSFGNLVQTGRMEGGSYTAEFEVENPRLWWCNGQGEPYEYPVAVTLYEENGAISDAYEQMYGIREIRFEKNEDTSEAKGSFLLKLNGRTVFINGYNWVPADMLYGAVEEERQAHLLGLAKRAGVNMLRVWGGGLIERDSFYRMCAEKGILVWQEFILSSSGIENRPSQEASYLEMMEQQAEIIVRKKRNHTALAVWCGGNELQEFDGTPLSDSHLLVQTLRRVVSKEDCCRKWLPTSPSGGVFLNSFDNLKGHPDELYDVHGPWEHQGMKKHYALYNAGHCRLHSEFGVEGMTNYRTLVKTTLPEHFWPANKDNPVYFHRGAWWNNEELVQESFGGVLKNAEQLRRASQYLQYEGLKYAMESNRRRAFFCSGMFPWQLNEPYPNLFCTSVVDYYGNPKPAYYGAKKVYSSWLVNAVFESACLAGGGKLEADIYTARNLPDDMAGQYAGYKATAQVWDMKGNLLWEKIWETEKVSRRAEYMGKAECLLPQEKSGLYLLRLLLAAYAKEPETDSCRRLAENEYLFAAGDDLSAVFSLEEPDLDICFEKSKIRVKNRGSVAAPFIFLTKEDGAALYWDDNYFTLLPGESKEIETEGSTEFVSRSALNSDWEVVYEGSCRN